MNTISNHRIRQILRETLEEFAHAEIGSGKWIPIYRVGQIEKGCGFFFAFDTEYYDFSDTAYRKNQAVKYLLNMDAKIWDPVAELDLDVISWSRIDGRTKDFERYGIADECTWEQPEEISSTSTDGLAMAGKNLGYQAVIIREVPQTRRPYNPKEGYGFDEICIFDTSIIKKC